MRQPIVEWLRVVRSVALAADLFWHEGTGSGHTEQARRVPLLSRLCRPSGEPSNRAPFGSRQVFAPAVGGAKRRFSREQRLVARSERLNVGWAIRRRRPLRGDCCLRVLVLETRCAQNAALLTNVQSRRAMAHRRRCAPSGPRRGRLRVRQLAATPARAIEATRHEGDRDIRLAEPRSTVGHLWRG